MTGPQSQLLFEAREFATELFLNKVNKSVRYHNLEHTERVVLACEELADYYSLQPEDRVSVLIAAWFHDTGFSSGAEGHEEMSKRLATSFLQERNADASLIQKVGACIDATKMPQSPTTLIEQIICDADLFHLGSEDFKIRNEMLMRELVEHSKENLSKKKWRRKTIAFMENHKYFTDYGKRKLQPVKERHIEELKQHDDNNNDSKKEGKKEKKEDKMLNVFTEELKKETETKKRKEKDNQTERGISTVFRIMASNHANLSQMADSKANIMISVNSIILSVVVSVLIRHLDENKYLILPTIMLVLVCVGTIIYAVKATRPNVSQGTFTKEDIQLKKTNLLFFGNFHSMALPDYDWAMKEMLNDKDYLYSSMVKDLYFLGVVLAKKYKLLRISYNIFMYGLIIAMFLYAVMISYDAFFVKTTVETTPFIK
ncbi:MAG: Pycsar system effector family protein [Chitinophagaceae bacterium]